MKTRRLIAALLAGVWMAASCFGEETKPVVGIMSFEGGGPGSPDISVLCARLSGEISRGGRHTVISRLDFNQKLFSARFNRSRYASLEEAAVAAGRLTGVDFVLTGTCRRKDSTWWLSAFLVDRKAGQVVKTRQVEVKGTGESFVSAAVQELGRALLGLTPPTPRPAPPAAKKEAPVSRPPVVKPAPPPAAKPEKPVPPPEPVREKPKEPARPPLPKTPVEAPVPPVEKPAPESPAAKPEKPVPPPEPVREKPKEPARPPLPEIPVEAPLPPVEKPAPPPVKPKEPVRLPEAVREKPAPAPAVPPARETDLIGKRIAEAISGKLSVGTRITWFDLLKNKRNTFLGTIDELKEQQDYVPWKLYATYFFDVHWGVDVSLDRFRAKTYTNQEDNHSDGDYVLTGPMISVVGRYPTDSDWTPFAGLGVAVMSGSFDYESWWHNRPGWTQYMDVNNPVGLVLTAGCDYRIKEHWSANLILRYLNLSLDDHFYRVRDDGYVDDRGTTSIPFSSVSLGAGIQYAF